MIGPGIGTTGDIRKLDPERRRRLYGVRKDAGIVRDIRLSGDRRAQFMDDWRVPGGCVYINGPGQDDKQYVCLCMFSCVDKATFLRHHWDDDGSIREHGCPFTVKPNRQIPADHASCSVCDQVIRLKISTTITRHGARAKPGWMLEYHVGLAGRECRGSPDWMRL